MRRHRIRLAVLAAAGFTAPVWWSWAASQLTYAIFHLSGAPDHPTRSLVWTSIYAPAIALGIATGVVVVVVLSEAPLRGWVFFICGLLVSSVLMGVANETLLGYLATMVSSVGNLLFLAGTALAPAIAQGRNHVG